MNWMRIDGQARTPLERRLSAQLKGVPAGLCPTFEQLLDLAQRGRRAPNYHALMVHIVSCPACRRSYLQMRTVLRARRSRFRRWLSRFFAPKI
jgi:hypothetical protein